MFVQVIDFYTDNIEAGNQLVDEYRERTRDKRTAKGGLLTADRDNPGHYVNLVYFDSYDEAMKNSQLPETQELAGKLAALAKEPPTFMNLDVIREMKD